MLLAILASVTVFVVYVLTLCPTVYVEGSGELIGAVCRLGTPHPPGYPLYCLLGRLVCAVLPLSSPARTVNVFTALTAAAAAGVLSAFLRSRGLGRWPAFSAALLLGFSQTYWGQAVVAEVYGLAVLFLVLALWAGLYAVARPEPGRLLLASYVMGMGLLAHLHQALLWPGLAAMLMWRLTGLRQRLQAIGLIGLGGLAGYSLVAYLPLRSGRGTAFHWGDISTAGQLWDHLAVAIYRSSFFALPPAAMLANAQRWLSAAYAEIHPLAVPVCLLGIWVLWRRDRPLTVALWALLACNLIIVVNYHRDPNGIVVFFLPSFLVMSIWAAAALDWLQQRAGYAAGTVFAVLLPMASMAENWNHADRSDSRLVKEYGLDILAGLPPDAVLLAEGDDAAFAVDYLMRMKGLRPDVTLYNRQGRGTDLLSGETLQLPAAQQARIRQQLEAELLRETDRPVYFLMARGIPAPEYAFMPDGLAYRAVANAETSGPGPPPKLNPVVLNEQTKDPWARKIQSNYWFMLGEHARARDDRSRAVQAYEEAGRIAHDSRTARYNVAVGLLRCGQVEAAQRHALAAQQLDPWMPAPYFLLARLKAMQGRHEEARHLHTRALELRPQP